MALQRMQNMRREMAAKRGDNWEKTYESNLRDFNRKRNDGLIRSFQVKFELLACVTLFTNYVVMTENCQSR